MDRQKKRLPKRYNAGKDIGDMAGPVKNKGWSVVGAGLAINLGLRVFAGLDQETICVAREVKAS